MSQQTLVERPLWPGRNWWLALLAILLLAGALRYPGYAFSLPYVATGEHHYMLDARLVIDFGTAKSLNMHHYPPGIISLNYALLRLWQDDTQPPTSVLGIARLVAITISMVMIVVTAMFGYHAFGDLAGLIGAGIWSITPTLLFYSRLQTADIYVSFFAILSLWLSFAGTRYRISSWTTYATYALMLAIVFKYQAILIAPLVLALPWLIGSFSWRALLGNLLRFTLFMLWLIFLTPMLEAFINPTETKLIETSWVRHVQLNELPSLSSIFTGVETTLGGLELTVVFFGLAGLLLMVRKSAAGGRLGLLYIAASALVWLVGVSLFDESAVRFYLVPVSLLLSLAGAGYASWWQLLRALPQRYPRLKLRVDALALVAFVLLVALNLPNLRVAIADARDTTLPDQRNDLATYMDETLVSGRHIAAYGGGNRTTLNRDWGGYAGLTPFPHLSPHGVPDPISQQPVEYWRAQDILYAIMSYAEYESLLADDPMGYLSETTLLKSYPPSAAHRGPAMVLLRLYPMQYPATGQLGPIHLLGYDYETEEIRAGESVSFHLYWRAEEPTVGDYVVFNHLLDAQGALVAQIDGPPLPDPLLRRGTKDWGDREEIIISREYTLVLPKTLAPGRYTLVTGFYRREDGTRLLSPMGEDSLSLTTLTVLATE